MFACGNACIFVERAAPLCTEDTGSSKTVSTWNLHCSAEAELHSDQPHLSGKSREKTSFLLNVNRSASYGCRSQLCSVSSVLISRGGEAWLYNMITNTCHHTSSSHVESAHLGLWESPDSQQIFVFELQTIHRFCRNIWASSGYLVVGFVP